MMVYIIALKAIKAATEAEPDICHLSGVAAMALEGNSSPFSCSSYVYNSEISMLNAPWLSYRTVLFTKLLLLW